MGSEFGETLKALRENAGLSLFALAKRITWSKAAVGHAETGVRPPSPELARALDQALGANGLLVAFAAADRDRRRNVSEVKRRELLKVIAASSAATGVPALAPSPRGRFGRCDVQAALDRTAQLRRLDDSLGGADTYSLYLTEVEATETVLRQATHSDDTRRALLSVLAEQAQLAGWAAFDAGWTNRSAQLYQESRRAATDAEDQSLIANALALDAYQRAFTGRVDVDLARASCEALTDGVPPSVQALIYDRAAWSYAIAGLTAETEDALSRAARAVTERGGSLDPDWASWVDLQEIDIMTGRCWSSLGRPLRAAPPLERALSAFPDAYARDKALYLFALAEAYLHGHEVELAAETIRRAHKLTIGVASTRPRARLKTTLALSARFDATQPMRDLRAQMADQGSIPH